MMGSRWTHNPHSGGVKPSLSVRQRTGERLCSYANRHYAGKFSRLALRFHGAFCYIDAYVEPNEPSLELLRLTQETLEEFMGRMRSTPLHLCRIRYFGTEERWSMAFYTYSNERYEPCAFENGSFYGTVEEAFEIGAVYLQGL